MLQSKQNVNISNRSIGIFNTAIQIQTLLHESGFKSVIAGGFARDLFFGREPKDCDIIIYGENALDFETVLMSGVYAHSDNVFAPTKVKSALRTHELFHGGHWCSMYGEKNSEEAMQDRVAGVFQLPHRNVDVIVYEDVDDAIGVIDAFDFNINQFAIVQDHTKGISYPFYFGQTDLRELVRVRNDASEQRQLKVFKKHQDLLPTINQYYDSGVLVSPTSDKKVLK